MQILSRLLSAMVLVLTLIFVAVFCVSLSSFSSAQSKPKSANSETVTSSLPSLILSRLNLVPFLRGERPYFAIVVENHEGARPFQAGLRDAVLIQEYFVEGFISRFIALFDERSIPKLIGPVRSLRPYFVDGMLPWAHIILHAGGSPEAFDRAREEPLDTINGLAYPDEFVRNDDIPPPHNLFIGRDDILKLIQASKYGLKVSWPPYAVGSPIGAPLATKIAINFYSPVHNVVFNFNAFTGTFTRTNGDMVSEAHPHNVLLLEVSIDSIGEHGRLFMTLTGKGNAMLFHSGKVQEGRWQRSSLKDTWNFTTDEGEEFQFAKGQTWMTVIPDLDRVKWE